MITSRLSIHIFTSVIYVYMYYLKLTRFFNIIFFLMEKCNCMSFDNLNNLLYFHKRRPSHSIKNSLLFSNSSLIMDTKITPFKSTHLPEGLHFTEPLEVVNLQWTEYVVFIVVVLASLGISGFYAFNKKNEECIQQLPTTSGGLLYVTLVSLSLTSRFVTHGLTENQFKM